jgi:hypothetical protein
MLFTLAGVLSRLKCVVVAMVVSTGTPQVTGHVPQPLDVRDVPYALKPLTEVRFGEPNPTYHSDPIHISNSQINVFRKEGPVAFYEKVIARTKPSHSSASLTRGTHVHLWAELGDQEFRERIRICPPDLVTAAGAFSKRAEEWIERQEPGTVPLTAEQAQCLLMQVEAIDREPMARALIAATQWREFSIRWTDDYGHMLRCRPDMATPDVFADIKTTKEKNPAETWWKAARDFGYAQQAAVYRWGAEQCGWPRHSLHFIVTSTAPPYHCFVCTLPEEWVRREAAATLRALDEIERRTELDCWVNNTHGQVTELFVPRFVMEESDDC